MTDSVKGGGTKQDPYRIEDVRQLQAVNEDLSAYYKLVSNINATNNKKQEFKPIGYPDDQFTGTFDGNNYEIRNLCIKRPERDIVGLFAYIGEEGRLKDIGIKNATITGRIGVGSLIGSNSGEIKSSYSVGGNVSGQSSIGGLVGQNYGKIESSYSVEGNVSGRSSAGGLVGRNVGEVESSYSLGDLSGDYFIGGLIGSNGGKIESSYSLKEGISGLQDIGALVGLSYANAQLENSSILSNSEESNVSQDFDLVISRENHRISYIIQTKKLHIQFNEEIYSCGDVPPTQVQALIDKEADITDRFMASVMKSR